LVSIGRNLIHCGNTILHHQKDTLSSCDLASLCPGGKYRPFHHRVLLYYTGLKFIFVALLLLFFSRFAFSSDFEYSLDYPEAITPFTVIPVFFDAVPDNVYSINTEITLIGDSKKNDCVLTHSTVYPILINTGNEYFSLIHFMWMFDEQQLTAIENMTLTEKNTYLKALPHRVNINITFDQPLNSYCELLKIDFTPEKNSRVVDSVWNLNNDTIRLTEPSHQKAVLFIHGLQNAVYSNMLSNLNSDTGDGWRSEELQDYWKQHYQFDDVDYFEYHYDTYFHDSSYYGDKLVSLMEQSGMLESYDEIYLVTYSMGTIVAQYAINTPLHNEAGCLGDKIENLFLIGGVLEGTYFVNLTDYLLTFITKEIALKSINTSYGDERDTFLYEMLKMLDNYTDLLLNPQKVQYFLDQFVQFYQDNPVIACLLLTSFDDVPVTGGQIVPYDGVKSMRYTSSDFLTKLEKEFKFKQTTYVINEELNFLNTHHQYKDKVILITSYASNSKEFLNKTAALMKFLHFVPDTEDSMSDTQLLKIPFIQYMIQRVLSIVIQSFAETISENAHILNDGFVTHWSQNLTPHHEGITSENLYIFDDLDHAQIKNAEEVLKVIRDRIND